MAKIFFHYGINKYIDPSEDNFPANLGRDCCRVHDDEIGCTGTVRDVIVYGLGINSMRFNYCERAVQEDKERGFVVETSNQPTGANDEQ